MVTNIIIPMGSGQKKINDFCDAAALHAMKCGGTDFLHISHGCGNTQAFIPPGERWHANA